MKDMLNVEIKLNDMVVFAPAGSYAGVSIGIVEKFTPKGIAIKPVGKCDGRHLLVKKYYYSRPNQVVKIKEPHR